MSRGEEKGREVRHSSFFFDDPTIRRVRVPGLRKSQEAGLKRGVYKGDDGTTSGAVQDGGVHKGLRKKGERGGACVLWYSERVA